MNHHRPTHTIEAAADPDETDPLWSERFAVVRANVRYKPGYELLLKPDQHGGRWYFQVQAERLDAVTGKPGVGRGGKAYLSPHATVSELVQTAFGLFKAYEEHEAREFFRWCGRPVFGPHHDVNELWRAAAASDARPAPFVAERVVCEPCAREGASS